MVQDFVDPPNGRGDMVPTAVFVLILGERR